MKKIVFSKDFKNDKQNISVEAAFALQNLISRIQYGKTSREDAPEILECVSGASVIIFKADENVFVATYEPAQDACCLVACGSHDELKKESMLSFIQESMEQ